MYIFIYLVYYTIRYISKILTYKKIIILEVLLLSVFVILIATAIIVSMSNYTKVGGAYRQISCRKGSGVLGRSWNQGDCVRLVARGSDLHRDRRRNRERSQTSDQETWI